MRLCLLFCLLASVLGNSSKNNKIATVGVYDWKWPRPKGLTFMGALSQGLMVSQAGPSVWESEDFVRNKETDNSGNLVWSAAASNLLGPNSLEMLDHNRTHIMDHSNTGKWAALYMATGPLLSCKTRPSQVFASRFRFLTEPITAVGSGTPLVILGIGLVSYPGCTAIGTLDKESLAFMKFVMGHVAASGGFVTVRGADTLQVMRNSGIGSSRILPVGGPSLLFNTNPSLGVVLQRKMLHVSRLMAERSTKLRVVIGGPSGRGNPLVMNFLVSLAKHFPTTHIAQGNAELVHMQNIFKENELRVESLLFYDISTWIEYLRDNADIFISPRIHGSMAAIKAEVPAITIPPDARAIEFCQSVQLPHFAHDKRLAVGGSATKDPRSLLHEVFVAYNGASFNHHRAEVAKVYMDNLPTIGLDFNPKLRHLAEMDVS